MPELTTTDVYYIFLAVGGGFVLAVWLVVSHLTARAEAREKTEQVRAREESRREIAAYVAEGSISAKEGALLLAAGADAGGRGVLSAAVEGLSGALEGNSLTPEEVEQLASLGEAADSEEVKEILRKLRKVAGVKVVVD